MKILYLHLGILPHKNIGAVVDIVEKHFPQAPFWAQLPNFSAIEGQFLQFLVNIPGIKSDVSKKRKYIDTNSYLYQSRSVEIIKDYDELSLEILKKYKPNSVFFENFLRIIELNKPKFAKGQVYGPISIGLLLSDEKGTPIIENGKVMDLILKSICLQCIAQICEMKNVCPQIAPYIFVEEPEICKVISSEKGRKVRKKYLSMLKTISLAIKNNGGIPVFHSPHCHDWSLAIEAGFEVLSFNTDSQFVTLLNPNIRLDHYLNAGNKLAWNLLPSDVEELMKTSVNDLFTKYTEEVNRLKSFYKLHKGLIISNSILTVGDPAGFSEPASAKAINLIKGLADRIEQEAAKINQEDNNWWQSVFMIGFNYAKESFNCFRVSFYHNT